MTQDEIRKLILTVYYTGRGFLEGKSTPITVSDAKKEYTDNLTGEQINAQLEEKVMGAPAFADTLIKGIGRII